MSSRRKFDVVFSTLPRLRDVVRATPSAPLPRVSVSPAKPPAPPPPDPLALARADRQAIEQTLASMRQSVEHLTARYEAMAVEMRHATVELATAIAGRLLFDKLQAGEFPIEEMVRQATQRLPPTPSVVVFLHPDDLSLLRQRLDERDDGSRNGEGNRTLGKTEPRLEADSAVPRGGCRAEAGEIHVLADLASSLAELRAQLLGSATHAESGSNAPAS